MIKRGQEGRGGEGRGEEGRKRERERGRGEREREHGEEEKKRDTCVRQMINRSPSRRGKEEEGGRKNKQKEKAHLGLLYFHRCRSSHVYPSKGRGRAIERKETQRKREKGRMEARKSGEQKERERCT